MRFSKGAALGMLAGCLSVIGCTPEYEKAKGKPFEELTLQNLMQWPAGQDYVEAKGSGRPPDAEKNQQLRRNASRDAAVLDAEKQMIVQLEKLVPQDQVRNLLRQARVGSIDYTYDDGCNLTLQIPKDAVTGKAPIQ